MTNHHIDCNSAFQKINIHAPLDNCATLTFYRTAYGYNNPLDRSCRLLNGIYYLFDLNISEQVLKIKLRIFAQSMRLLPKMLNK